MKQSKDEVYMVYGGVDGEEREEIRRLVQKSNNADIIASYATFSTGTNIPNLNNLILASPVKSKIRLLQSIGRILRLGDDKTHCTLFDCADDLRAKGKMNTTLTHLQERMKLYDAEGFDYKVINIPLYKGNELNV
jgi:superfamily II DNA or RNA helicase